MLFPSVIAVEPRCQPFAAAAAARSRPARAACVVALCALTTAAAIGVMPSPLHAQLPSLDIKRLTLEELMDIDVYSASRRLEPVQTSPSATYVLTGEDIRRSRVTSVPEALRLVPGVQVGRVDANKWAVSIRGFNSREANKILVLIDGRAVYDPLFSGTLWEAQDVMLEDVERIEVIRGPGGTLWGANAFNGVINIITKHARDTQGGLVSAGLGTEERYFAAARYGWQTGDNHYARVYAESFERDEGFFAPSFANDGSRMSRGGFRWDWKGARDEVRVSGDVSTTDAGERINLAAVQDVEHRGSNLIARWTRRYSATETMDLQFYYNHIGLRSDFFDHRHNASDLHFQRTVQAAARHFLVWGAGYRNMRDHAVTALPGVVDVLPARRHYEQSNIFLQDTITLSPERWHLVLGAKLENTDYAEHEWLPSARVSWTPNPRETWWASVSRAVRMPSRLEADLTSMGSFRPGDAFAPEHVVAYEFGHRRLVSPRFWYDIATFYNDYSDLRTREADQRLRNFMSGHGYGLELAARWTPLLSWRLDVAYTYLETDLGLDPGSTGDVGQPGVIEGLAPRHQLAVRSAYDFAPDLEFDAMVRFVDKLPAIAVPAYTTLDLALTWYPHTGLELSLVGQNLLDSHHPEQDFVFGPGVGSEVQRGVYVKATQRF